MPHQLSEPNAPTDEGSVSRSAVDEIDAFRRSIAGIDLEARRRRVGDGVGIDSRDVVDACVDYADAIGRIPSIGELCIAAHLSERRLRRAFVDQFGLPPTRYFRIWGLALTHRRLLESSPDRYTVTEIAVDAGFGHLGRFAGHYRAAYGRSPSATLRMVD